MCFGKTRFGMILCRIAFVLFVEDLNQHLRPIFVKLGKRSKGHLQDCTINLFHKLTISQVVEPCGTSCSTSFCPPLDFAHSMRYVIEVPLTTFI